MISSRVRSIAVIFICLSFLVGCDKARRESESFAVKNAQQQLEDSKDSVSTPSAPMQQVSLKQADEAGAASPALDRKIIQDGELTMEVGSPVDAQRNIVSITGARGGFVVTSESKQRQSSDSSKHDFDLTLVIRVPAPQFTATLDQIRAIGGRIIGEKETGQDVTEEFIDLEARIKTQKALESQFLEIMKQANKVADALEVQRQIAQVRTEIEKLEGRKRFLENRSSLSTITVNLMSPTTIVTSSGFARQIKDTFADSVDLAAAIVLFLVRFVIVMIPIFILLILPGVLIARYFVRRAKRFQMARKLEQSTVEAGS